MAEGRDTSSSPSGFSCTFSSFGDSETNNDTSDLEFSPEEGSMGSTIEPYMYEPEESGSDSDSESTDSSDDSMHGERLLNTDW